jgi:hypothetical protein
MRPAMPLYPFTLASDVKTASHRIRSIPYKRLDTKGIMEKFHTKDCEKLFSQGGLNPISRGRGGPNKWRLDL